MSCWYHVLLGGGCSQQSYVAGGKKGLCPLPHPLWDSVPAGHSFTYVSISHMQVTVLCNLWLQSICKYIPEVTFCCWIVDSMYLSAHTCHIYVFRPLLLSHLLSWTKYQHISCLFGSNRTRGIPFLVGHTVLQQFVFCSVSLSNKSGEVKKLCVY